MLPFGFLGLDATHKASLDDGTKLIEALFYFTWLMSMIWNLPMVVSFYFLMDSVVAYLGLCTAYSAGIFKDNRIFIENTQCSKLFCDIKFLFQKKENVKP